MITIQLLLELVFAVVVVAVVWLTSKRAKVLRYREELRQWQAQNPDPAVQWQTPPPTRPPTSGWSTAGTVLAAIAAVGGLAVLAGVVLLFVALSWGNFKFGNK